MLCKCAIYLCFSLLYADATAIPMATFGEGSGPILIDNAACTGTEMGLLNCNYDASASDCMHSEDAGIRCSTGPCKKLS